MKIESFLERLRQSENYRNQIESVKIFSAQEPVYVTLSKSLPNAIENYLDRKNIRLYSHQARAIELIREQKNVLITTPTASGKTLAFNLPIFERLAQSKTGTALYLYPLKALCNDQLNSLQQLEAGTMIKLGANIYDGDTPEHQRPKIREKSRIILSNPYALHQYLSWHHKWKRFFENLQFVVLDEAHWYRGVFGANVSLLLRRLERIVSFYCARPQFILSSATMANPLEHARKLTGQHFSIIAEDGSGRGRKYFVLWNALKNQERSAHRQASDLLVQSVNADLQTLCFTFSRKLAELTVMWTQGATHKNVATYRAGYLPEERRQIEKALKEGALNGVAATNALELGIDVGGLDSIILSGYPGTMLSTWQRAGRAGRSGQDALITLMGFENPLDQYFMRHPDHFFERPHEHAVIDLDNEHILLPQMMCAAAELPLRETEREIGGEKTEALLAALEAQKLIHKTPMGWVYRGMARPADVVSLDSISSQTVRLLCEGQVLETLEYNRALEEAHPGAVFLHRGETLLIESLNLGQSVATARRSDVDYYTETLKSTQIRIRGVQGHQKFGEFDLSYGDVLTQHQVIGYRTMRFDKPLGVHALESPQTEFETVALWLTLPIELRDTIKKYGLDWSGGLHAAEHALIAMIPFLALCDRWDIGGLSTALHSETGLPTIFIYDGFLGGIGIAEKAFELFSQLVKHTHELVRDCACEKGCPSCIYSPKCGNGNEPLDKNAALIILAALAEATKTI
jgi:DEAD/DEAH box helicase domain-containing protein